MASKKPRKKKFDGKKQASDLARAFIGCKAMMQLDQDNCRVVRLDTGEEYPAGTKLISQFTHIPHKWNILLCVFCKERNGKLKMSTLYLRTARPYMQSELGEWLHKEHLDLIDDCRSKMEVTNIGWLATPYPDIAYDLEPVCEMFESFGVWDNT